MHSLCLAAHYSGTEQLAAICSSEAWAAPSVSAHSDEPCSRDDRQHADKQQDDGMPDHLSDVMCKSRPAMF